MLSYTTSISAISWWLAVLLSLLAVWAPPAEEVEHPVDPLLQVTRERLEEFRRDVRTYQCIVSRRERVAGRLMPEQHVFLRVRCRPFAVYLKVLGPQAIAGRELLYNPQRYGERVIVKNGGPGLSSRVTLALRVDDPRILRETNYPVREWGMEQTLATIIKILSEERATEVSVDYFSGAKVDGRPASVARLRHVNRQQHARFYEAVMYIDDEWRLPVYYQATDWPQKPGGQPVLLEQFRFMRWEVNVPLSDEHFDYRYPEYGFNASKQF